MDLRKGRPMKFAGWVVFSLLVAVRGSDAGQARLHWQAVFDPGMVWWSIGTRVDASKKVYIVDGLSPSRIDPSAEEAIEAGATVGGLVIDSTKPIGKPFAEVGYPAEEVLKQIQLLDYISKEKVDKLAVASSYIGSA